MSFERDVHAEGAGTHAQEVAAPQQHHKVNECLLVPAERIKLPQELVAIVGEAEQFVLGDNAQPLLRQSPRREPRGLSSVPRREVCILWRWGAEASYLGKVRGGLVLKRRPCAQCVVLGAEVDADEAAAGRKLVHRVGGPPAQGEYVVPEPQQAPE